jgi:hypothetical protein
MLSNTDKSHGAPLASPGYETRDANTRGVFSFLLILALVLAFTLLVSWGLFRYFAAEQAHRAPASPFAETRQLPSGPQLQVNPRQDFLKFHADQEQSLESYAWENRDAGTVRVPIERAMELLLQKGIPVAGETSNREAGKPAPKGGTKP